MQKCEFTRPFSKATNWKQVLWMNEETLMIMKWLDQTNNESLDQMSLNEPWHTKGPMDETWTRWRPR